MREMRYSSFTILLPWTILADFLSVTGATRDDVGCNLIGRATTNIPPRSGDVTLFYKATFSPPTFLLPRGLTQQRDRSHDTGTRTRQVGRHVLSSYASAPSLAWMDGWIPLGVVSSLLPSRLPLPPPPPFLSALLRLQRHFLPGLS
jgi:hypothetical protein